MANRTHGYSNKSQPTYKTWLAMRQRCLNPSDPEYHNYGGRGIKICERWLNNFSLFLADMGEKPEGLSIDRFPNNNGDYEPGNCRWATPAQQTANRRVTTRLEYNGRIQDLMGWVKELGIDYKVLESRIRRGWTAERALITKVKPHRKERIRVQRSSKFRGVTWDMDHASWRARITINKKVINIGRFKDEADAAQAYNFLALELYGERAIFNIPLEASNA